MTDSESHQQHQQGPADAFAALVREHVDWVYSAAKRKVIDPQLAEDVTQAVFITLARKRPQLRKGPLSPWLFGTLLRTCKAALRARATRRRHETEAAKMRPQTLESPANAQWSDIAPHLEEMVRKLRSSDREIVLLRFYEQKSFAEIAELIGITEDAARKRVSRSVEALRGMLSRRGVSMPAVALGVVLVAEVVKPAPAAVAKSASVAATSAVVPASVSLINAAVTLMSITKLGATIVACAALLAIFAVVAVLPRKSMPLGTIALAVTPATKPTPDWRTRFDDTYKLKDGEVLKRVAPPFIPERDSYWDDHVRGIEERGGRVAQRSYPVVFFRQTDTLASSGVVSGGQASIPIILNGGIRLNSYEWDGDPALLNLRISGDWVIRDGADVASMMSALGSILSEEFKRPLRFVPRATEQQVIVVTGKYSFRAVAESPANYPEVVHIAIGPPDIYALGRRGTVRGSLHSFLESAGHHVRLRFVDHADQPILDQLQWVEHDSAAALASMKPGAEKDAAIENLLDSLHAQTGLRYTLEWQTFPVWFMEESRP